MSGVREYRRSAPAPKPARYGILAADSGGLTDGRRYVELRDQERGTFVRAVEDLDGVRETVVWVHESAAQVMDLADRTTGGNSGWGWVVRGGAKAIHLAPAWNLPGFMNCADGGDLGVAAQAFADATGLGLVISAGRTIHQLITGSAHRARRSIGPAELEPEIAWANSAYFVEAFEYWTAPLPSSGWLRFFDRSGSYLSAWSGTILSDGIWCHVTDPPDAGPGPESSRPVGYSLVELGEARRVLEDRPDPFKRWGTKGPVWLTTPLLQLAVDLAGRPLEVLEAWWVDGQCRALDGPGQTLRDGRASLLARAGGSAAHAAALAALKDGYATATAWFEFGPRAPEPLGRPYWRRAVIDRFVANTYRALSRCEPAPLVWGHVDTAGFVLGAPSDVPAGMRLGTELGAWKPAGRALDLAQLGAGPLEGREVGLKDLLAIANG